MICQKCVVSGRVQGVFYRDTTQKRANSLGITGHAYNLSDGTVEVFMCGSEKKLQQMKIFLWEGSSWSDVNDIQCQEIDLPPPVHFTTR